MATRAQYWDPGLNTGILASILGSWPQDTPGLRYTPGLKILLASDILLVSDILCRTVVYGAGQWYMVPDSGNTAVKYGRLTEILKEYTAV